jgi:Ca-activated chloride channel family protein
MGRTSLIGGILILLAAFSIVAAGASDTRGMGNPSRSGPDRSVPKNEATSVAASPSLSGVSGDQSWTLANSILPAYTFRSTVLEVHLQFSVADEHGRLVTSLSANDFRIVDDQSAIQRIRQFSRVEDLPLQIGILLDVSDSVKKNVVHEKVATQFLLQQVLRPQTDRAFLMGFGHDVKVWQPSTGDLTALLQAVERIQQLGYTTNLYDGLFSACFGQFPQAREQDGAQRVIVLFSDGEDTDSLHGMPDVIALAQRQEIQIFALSIHPRSKPTPGDEVLRRLADETGGQFYVATSDKQLSTIFTEMEQQMRTQYNVSFQPQKETPGYHSLRLELTGPQKMRVCARQGYYFDVP